HGIGGPPQLYEQGLDSTLPRKVFRAPAGAFAAPSTQSAQKQSCELLCSSSVTNSMKLRGIRASDSARLSAGKPEKREVELRSHRTDASPAVTFRRCLFA